MDQLVQTESKIVPLYDFPPALRESMVKAKSGAILGEVESSGYYNVTFQSITDSNRSDLGSHAVTRSADSILCASLSPEAYTRFRREAVLIGQVLALPHVGEVQRRSKFPRFDEIQRGTVLRLSGRYFVVEKLNADDLDLTLLELAGRNGEPGEYRSHLSYKNFHLGTDTVFEIQRLGEIELVEADGVFKNGGWRVHSHAEWEPGLISIDYEKISP